VGVDENEMLMYRFEGGRSSYEEHSVEKQFGSMSPSPVPSFPLPFQPFKPERDKVADKQCPE
jgi:hypothetical protein